LTSGVDVLLTGAGWGVFDTEGLDSGIAIHSCVEPSISHMGKWNTPFELDVMQSDDQELAKLLDKFH